MAQVFDIVLADDENITRVLGTYRETINSLCIHTSTGRVLMIGTGNGTYFSMSRIGKVVKYFKVGFSSQMDTIGAYFESNKTEKGHCRRYSTPIAAPVPTQIGRQFTPHTDQDQEDEKSSESEDGQADDDFNEVQEYGAFGDSGALPTRMHDGIEHKFEFEHEVEPTPIKAEPRLCLPVPKISDPRTIGFLNGIKSNVCGQAYADSFYFDNYNENLKGHNYVNMTEVRVIHDKNCVYGFQTVYKVDGVDTVSSIHSGKAVHESALFESVPLQYGETIVEINGRINEVIIGLKIITSTGKTYGFGNYNDGKFFSLNIPPGKKVIGLAGEYQQYLHNMACYYC